MSHLSSETMMKLMAYADGELDDAEKSDVEALLAKSSEAKQFVAQIMGLGGIVAALHEGQNETIARFDIADAVMAKVEEAPAVSRRGEIAGGAAGRGIRSISSLEIARARRASQMKVTGGIVGALALAAAVFLVARDKETPMAKAPSVVAANNDSSMNNAGPGVEVDVVQSEGNSVSVFYLPSSNELSTSVVVWVDETGEK